jgi:hypothetical protein
MAFLAAAAPYIGLAATGVSAYSQAEAGKAQAAQIKLQGIQDDRDANAALAEAQGQAANERRRAKILRSRALALAGASGTSVDSPSIVDALDSIEEEGEIRALNSLYEGNYLAAGLRSGAGARGRMASSTRNAGNMNALATGFEGVTTFAGRYG